MRRRPMCLVCAVLMLILYGMDLMGISGIRGNPLSFSDKQWISNQNKVTVCGEVVKQTRKKDSQSVYLKNAILYLDLPSSHLSKIDKSTINHSKINISGIYNFCPDNLTPNSYQLNNFELNDYLIKNLLFNNTEVYYKYLAKSYPLKTQNMISLHGLIAEIDTESKVLLGSKILLEGKLIEMESAGNPGSFDERSYYACKKTYYRMNDARILAETENVSFWVRETDQVRQKAIDILENCAGEDAPYFEALLLGDKSKIEGEEKELWQQAGILHILTVSGLHVGILGSGLMELLFMMGMGLVPVTLLSFGILLFYGILTGSGAAVLRAAIMLAMKMGGRTLGRSFDPQTALSCSVILLLLDCPAWLFSASFWLSFSAVLGIYITGPALMETWKCKNKIWNSFLFSTAVQITMLPVILYFYGEISVFGIFLNMLILPTVVLVLLSGIFLLIIGFFWSRGGCICAVPAKLLIRIYQLLAKTVMHAPAVTWIPGRPGNIQLIIYIFFWSVLLWFLCWQKRKDRKKKAKEILSGKQTGGKKYLCFCVKYLNLFLIITISVFLLTCQKKDCLSITCLDVGQGDAIVITTPDGRNYLSDCGSSSLGNVGVKILIPFLKLQGISRIDGIFLSHADEDHLNGILDLLEEEEKHLTSIQVGIIWIPEIADRNDSEMKKLFFMAERAGVQVRSLSKGDKLKSGFTEFCILSPDNHDTAPNKNDSSLVLELKHGEFQALFTGDISREKEETLIKDTEAVDFLKVAHHGSGYSSGLVFLEKIHPKISVISCAEKNVYGHPSPDTIKRLEQVGSEVYCTMKNGAVTVKTDGKQISVRSYRTENGF